MPQKQKVSSVVSAPLAPVKPEILEKHGYTRIDPYYWLNERDNPEVIDYLKAENDYADVLMAHRKQMEDELFEEIKGRIKQTDLSVPYKLDDYYYYTRFDEGKEYPIFCRKKKSLQAEEHVILDANLLAKGIGMKIIHK